MSDAHPSLSSLRLDREATPPGPLAGRRVRLNPHARSRIAQAIPASQEQFAVAHALPAPDIRSFYPALAVGLPEWARNEATVRCSADPEAISHGDRDPSWSINPSSDAWKHPGGGASGGAFDAAIGRDRTKRSAIDPMVRHGRTELARRPVAQHRAPDRRVGYDPTYWMAQGSPDADGRGHGDLIEANSGCG